MGGSKTNPFNLVVNGVASVPKELWIDLGLIPTGSQYQIGKGTFTSTDKTIAVEIRTNPVGKSAGNITDTTLCGTCSVRAGATGTIDLWRSGRLVIKTPLSTGVEHWWVHCTSKTITATDLIWAVSYLGL